MCRIHKSNVWISIALHLIWAPRGSSADRWLHVLPYIHALRIATSSQAIHAQSYPSTSPFNFIPLTRTSLLAASPCWPHLYTSRTVAISYPGKAHLVPLCEALSISSSFLAAAVHDYRALHEAASTEELRNWGVLKPGGAWGK